MSGHNNCKIHNVILEQRQKLNMTGVLEVEGYDEETVVLSTELGRLTVKGESLKIASFSRSSGEVDINGDVVALVYSDTDLTRGGILRRLLK